MGNTKIQSAPRYGEITEHQYAEMVERARWTACLNCEKPILRQDAVRGPSVKGGSLYCSAKCVSEKEIKVAPKSFIEKPGVRVDGWQV